MAKRRVIEDSDDEDDVETTSIRQPAADLLESYDSVAIGSGDSPENHSTKQSTDPSTGSTGLYLALKPLQSGF